MRENTEKSLTVHKRNEYSKNERTSWWSFVWVLLAVAEVLEVHFIYSGALYFLCCSMTESLSRRFRHVDAGERSALWFFLLGSVFLCVLL